MGYIKVNDDTYEAQISLGLSGSHNVTECMKPDIRYYNTMHSKVHGAFLTDHSASWLLYS